MLMAQMSYSLLSGSACPPSTSKMGGEGSSSISTSAPVFWALRNLSESSDLNCTLSPKPDSVWCGVRGDRLEVVSTCLRKKPPLLFRNSAGISDSIASCLPLQSLQRLITHLENIKPNLIWHSYLCNSTCLTASFLRVASAPLYSEMSLEKQQASLLNCIQSDNCLFQKEAFFVHFLWEWCNSVFHTVTLFCHFVLELVLNIPYIKKWSELSYLFSI